MKTLDIWACDNGCGNEVEEYLLTQMASPDDTKLMLVCPSCVYDEWLEDWRVELEDDPR